MVQILTGLPLQNTQEAARQNGGDFPKSFLFDGRIGE
jgi:hypothetical protein